MTVSAAMIVALPALAATLAVSPGSGEPGQSVTVSGDEFDPSLANCTLHVNTGETPTASDLVGGCAVDAGGVLTGSFAVPDLPAGNYQVWACNRPGLADCNAGSAESASTGLTIEEPPPPDPDPTTTTTTAPPSGGGGGATTTTTTSTTTTTTTTPTTDPSATTTSPSTSPAPAPLPAPSTTAANLRSGRLTSTTIVTVPPTALAPTTAETSTTTTVSAKVAGVTLVSAAPPIPEVVAASGAGLAVSAPQIAIGLVAAAALGGMWVQVRKFKLRRWIKRSSPGWIKRPPL
jgi:hypothetical protein